MNNQGNTHRFEVNLPRHGLSREHWERTEREIQARRLKQITSISVSLQSGVLTVEADFGLLTDRHFDNAAGLLESRVNMVVHGIVQRTKVPAGIIETHRAYVPA